MNNGGGGGFSEGGDGQGGGGGDSGGGFSFTEETTTCKDGLVKCCTDGSEPDNGMCGMQTADCFYTCGECTTKPCAAALLNDVGYTTAAGTSYEGHSFSAGENIYGPFEAGFDGAGMQAGIIESLGCSSSDTASVYVEGGIDTVTAEQMVAYACGITLPRNDSGTWVGLVDSCGGHTEEYHFHERLSCLYAEVGNHSAQVGETLDGDQYLYGKWEDFSAELLPELDACGGHYGFTPDSPATSVYHYHVQATAPFTFGCYGPNADGTVVTQAQCEALYTGCSDEYGLSSEVTTTELGTFYYKRWCPCGNMSYYSATALNGSPYGSSTTSLTGAGIGTIVGIVVVALCMGFCVWRQFCRGKSSYAGSYVRDSGMEMRSNKAGATVA